MVRLRNAAVSAAIRSIKSPNCWPKGPIKYGPGSEARPGIARIKLSGGQFEAPNTKLMGPVKWSYFYLYVILDIFSRRVTGWRVEDAESAARWCGQGGGWRGQFRSWPQRPALSPAMAARFCALV